MAFPATYNIQYYQGDTYQFVIQPKSSSGETFSISSTTHDAYFRIATQRGGAEGTGTASGTATISANSVICTIAPSVGNSLNPSTVYYYDVSVQSKTDPNNIVYTLLTGTISVTADIGSAP